MALPGTYPRPTNVRSGIVLALTPGASPDALLCDAELQRAPDSSGSPGTWVTIEQLPPLPRGGAHYFDVRPIDGAVWWYRYRHVRSGFDPSANWTAAVSGKARKVLSEEFVPLLSAPLVSEQAIADLAVSRIKVGATLADTLANVGRQDLVLNGDFETGFSFWKWNGDGTASIETGADRYKGAKSLKLVQGGNQFPRLDQVDDPLEGSNLDGGTLYTRVEAGERILIIGTAKWLSGAGGSSHGAITVEFYSDTKAFVSSVSVDWPNTQTTFLTKRSYFEVPAGVFYAVVSLQMTPPGLSNTGTVIFDEVHAYRLPREAVFDNGDKSANFTIDWSNGPLQRVRLTAGGLTVTFAGGYAGLQGILEVVQDGTGSRTITTWSSPIRWPGGTAPTLTTTANRRDVFEFYYQDALAAYLGRTYGLNYT